MPETKMAPRRRARLDLVAVIAAGGPLRDQAALRGLLAAEGHPVSQPQVSRDLRALGYVRGPRGWASPSEAANAGARRAALRELRDALDSLDR